ncbi:hypothetical protein OEZ85_013198 [Tetradesmus obliquus]|uniref:ERD4-related membrane protein n=1 Tax=Tetradesmus obliquus TaxID=3088 RepID=A0ABY8U5M7_TETOB|nr:hypothetical protein OEZ85_013198 [Tetradesmus obliquus]
MAVTGVSLATALGINGGVCCAFLIIFSILRIKPFTRKFYAPKRFDPEVRPKPKKLPNGLFSWIAPTLFYDEGEMLRTAGMDVVVMVRLLSYGWVLFAFCTFWCCALLMPINGTAGFLARLPPTPATSDLDLLSTSNVPQGSPRMWAHLISAYVVSLVALGLLVGFSNDVSRLRARFMSTLPRGGTSHSVLITDIPCVDGLGAKEPSKSGAATEPAGYKEERLDAELGGKGSVSGHHGYTAIDDDVLCPWADARSQLRSGNAESMVRNEMATTYGEPKVAAVNVVYNTAKLDPLLAKYDKSKSQLEDITDDYIGKLRRGKEIKKRKEVSLLPAITPKWAKERYNVGTKAVKVDALEYLPQEMEHLLGEMKTEREAIKEAHLPAAFVTFNDRASANAAATGLQSYDETAWRIQPAPDSEEIIWGNLSMRYKQRVMRSLGMWVVFIAMLVFYLPITAAIQMVVNLQNASAIPGLNVIVRLPFVTQVLQGILPGLVLKIFLILVPPILKAMARFEGKVSLSEVDFSVVGRFFIFQVFAVFIFNFLLGTVTSDLLSVVNKFREIADEPTKRVPELLGVGAAQTSSFYMSYILINACAIGGGLLRLVGLILFFVFMKLAGTERARYRLWAKQNYEFGTNVANHTMVLLLGLAFTVLAPLIAPFCLLYFSLALLAQKYQLVYVVTLPYQAAGRMWMNCFNQIMTGIYFLQVMALCVLLVKGFAFAALIIPLVVFTAVVHSNCTKLFRRPWTLMSAKEAAILDKRDPADISPAELDEVRGKYLSPVFKVDEAEHAALLQQAGQVDRHLKGEASGLDLSEPVEEAEDDA